MAKIGLLADTDSPSIPLMKISAFHKKQGDEVKFVDNYFEHFDKVYISKIFNLDLKTINPLIYFPTADEIQFGGSGFAISVENNKEVYNKEKDKSLPKEIESMFPDYSLYGEKTKNIACGFLTRGCPNNCEFCIVSKKDGLCCRKVADLQEFWNGQKTIKLYDANILACKDREELIKQLIQSGAVIDYTQGLNARLIDDDIAKLLAQTKIQMVHFAFDLMKNEERILKGLKIFAKHFNKSDRFKRVYILTNFNTTLKEDYFRVKKVLELGYSPYVMIYRKGTHPQFLTDLQRWSNNMFLQKAVSFEDYAPRKDGKSMKTLYAQIIKGE